MEAIDSKIITFIKEHHVLTLATAAQGDVWCSNAFYAFDEKDASFVITSDINTRHISMARISPCVAGSIVLETETVGLIRGLQFTATIDLCQGGIADSHRLLYLKRFPYAVLSVSELWILTISELKYTDNRLGFGKKICCRVR
jgi:uncharacterized protein